VRPRWGSSGTGSEVEGLNERLAGVSLRSKCARAYSGCESYAGAAALRALPIPSPTAAPADRVELARIVLPFREPRHPLPETEPERSPHAPALTGVHIAMASNHNYASTGDARPGAEVSRPQVIAIWDGGWVSRPAFEGESLRIGRASDCDVVIDHPSVSRRHALLSLGSPARIEDLGSANGTRIGNVVLRSNESARLEPEQAVAIGEALLVVHGGSNPSELRRIVASAPSSTLRPFNDTTRRVHEVVDLVARSSLPVLLLGQTGVGRGVVAETIHRRSPRAARPFVAVNCARVPSALLDRELFGEECDPLIGAGQAKTGLVESADGGTMFLDEIEAVDARVQAKLLRVLERGEFVPVGSVRARVVDVRFVAATNRSIQGLVSRGAFREDLYFRLKGVSVVVPPLAAHRTARCGPG
jgi:two-component system response regulator AtoC